MNCPECGSVALLATLKVKTLCEIIGDEVSFDYNMYYDHIRLESIICDNCGYRLDHTKYHLPKEG
jgi:C4-type Zn-finger protein